MLTLTPYLIAIGLLLIAFLIFSTNLFPNWVCQYLGHTRPKNPKVPKYSDHKLVGKCSRCGKLVENDTDYPNKTWY